MGKNILIFSDGTGQSGGVTFDEDRTNIYKIFRATRCAPDSNVDPAEQVAFYDPGLGSPRDNHFLFGWFGRKLYNLISQATGFGITANIIDCYAAIIRLWRPGDRIFLFGFSRGAYTVRCLAAVIANCGIPTTLTNGQAAKLDTASSRKLASYAVKRVYQFTSSRPKDSATPRQTFLLQTRDLVAMRFRKEHASLAENRADANAYPYFIGVFDTVASLFDKKQFALLVLLFLVVSAILSAILLFVPHVPIIGRFFWFLSHYKFNFVGLIALVILMSFVGYVLTHLKFDFHVPGYNWKQCLRTIHWTELYQTFSDYTLNKNVPYAKHAISINENRKDFKRVGWDPGETDRPVRDANGNVFFEQVWFPGNHADIGGGYPENESRLSDISLKWMLTAATIIPHPMRFDSSVLMPHPSPDGRVHNEVKSGFGILTTLTGWTWPEHRRELPKDQKTGISNATMHGSVYQRFDLREAFQYDVWALYRPETLRNHVDFTKYYGPGAVIPATSLQLATALADDPAGRQR